MIILILSFYTVKGWVNRWCPARTQNCVS